MYFFIYILVDSLKGVCFEAMFSEGDYIDCPFGRVTAYYTKKLERRMQIKFPELNMALAEWVAHMSTLGYYVGTYRAVRNTIDKMMYIREKALALAMENPEAASSVEYFEQSDELKRCHQRVRQRRAELEVMRRHSTCILRSAFECIYACMQQRREARHEIVEQISDALEDADRRREARLKIEQLSSARILRSAFGCMQTRIQQRKKAEEEIRAVAEELVNKAFEQVDEKYKAEKDFNNNEEAEMELIEPVKHVAEAVNTEPVAEAAEPDVLEPLWKEKLSVNQCICQLISEGPIGREYLESYIDNDGESSSCKRFIDVAFPVISDEVRDKLNTKYESYEELKIVAKKLLINKLFEEPINDKDDEYDIMIKALFNTDNFKKQLLENVNAITDWNGNIDGQSIYRRFIGPRITKETYNEWTTPATREAFETYKKTNPACQELGELITEAVNDKYRAKYNRLWAEDLSESQCSLKLLSEEPKGKELIDSTIEYMELKDVSCQYVIESINQSSYGNEELLKIYPGGYHKLIKNGQQMYHYREHPNVAAYLYGELDTYVVNDVVIKVLFDTDAFRNYLYSHEKDFTEDTGANEIYKSLIVPFINRELFNEWTTPNTVDRFKRTLNGRGGTGGNKIIEELKALADKNDKAQKDKYSSPFNDDDSSKGEDNDDEYDRGRGYNNNRRRRSRNNMSKNLTRYVDTNNKPRRQFDITNRIANGIPSSPNLTKRGRRNQTNNNINKISLDADHEIIVSTNEANKKITVMMTKANNFTDAQRDFIVGCFAYYLLKTKDESPVSEDFITTDDGQIERYTTANLLLIATLNELDNEDVEKATKYIENHFMDHL